MTYKTLIVQNDSGDNVEYVYQDLPEGGVRVFANVETNDGGERVVYQQWLAEGNTPEDVTTDETS
jgi:hypothetical protein